MNGLSLAGIEFVLIFLSLLFVFIVLKRSFRSFTKANERLVELKNTNKVLDELFCQLGVKHSDEIKIREIKTGRISTLSFDDWIKLKNKRKYALSYEVVKTSS